MREGILDGLEQRVERVLALISSNLGESLPVRRLASEAALSACHFDRIWRATTGEPIGETIRRLRLEKAIHSLQTTSGSVTEIAFDAGFASSQAFSRAFKQATGFSPRDCRRKAIPSSFIRKRQSEENRRTFEVEIVSLEPFQVVSKRHRGRYDEGRLAQAFRVPRDWAIKHGHSQGLRGIYGVPYDAPSSVPASRLRYDARLDLGPDIQPPPNLRRRVLGGGEFGKLTVIGSYEQLEAAYQHLLGIWLPRSGCQAADPPLFDHS